MEVKILIWVCILAIPALSVPCAHKGIAYVGKSIVKYRNTFSWFVCSRHCRSVGGCKVWTWYTERYYDRVERRRCYLYNNDQVKKNISTAISGPPSCGKTYAHYSCARDYEKMGCYGETLTGMDLIVNDRDGTHNGYDGHILDWSAFLLSMHSLACRCSQRAKEGRYAFFAIRYWAECWAGKNISEIDTSPSNVRTNCASAMYETCEREHENECVGTVLSDYVYVLKPKGDELLGKEQALQKGNGIKILDALGKQFKITFDFYPSSSGSKSNIIHLTSGGKKGKMKHTSDGHGESIFGVFYHDGKFLMENVKEKNTRYADSVLKKWNAIELGQTKNKDGKYTFYFKVDGSTKFSIIKEKAEVFRNVHIYVSDPWNTPQPGWIRKLYIKQDVDGGYSEWESWSHCSETCGDGIIERERTCTEPLPYGDGKDCSRLGERTDVSTCHEQPCEVSCEKENTDYANGEILKKYPNTEYWEICAGHCRALTKCTTWTLYTYEFTDQTKQNLCVLKNSASGEKSQTGAVSGSPLCGLTTACQEESTQYIGTNIGSYSNTDSWQTCSDYCRINPKCISWLFCTDEIPDPKSKKQCSLFSSVTDRKSVTGTISGSRVCGETDIRNLAINMPSKLSIKAATSSRHTHLAGMANDGNVNTSVEITNDRLTNWWIVDLVKVAHIEQIALYLNLSHVIHREYKDLHIYTRIASSGSWQKCKTMSRLPAVSPNIIKCNHRLTKARYVKIAFRTKKFCLPEVQIIGFYAYVNDPCEKKDFELPHSHDEIIFKDTTSWEVCSDHCRSSPACTGWTWNTEKYSPTNSKKKCKLTDNNSGAKHASNKISGTRLCGGSGIKNLALNMPVTESSRPDHYGVTKANDGTVETYTDVKTPNYNWNVDLLKVADIERIIISVEGQCSNVKIETRNGMSDPWVLCKNLAQPSDTQTNVVTCDHPTEGRYVKISFQVNSHILLREVQVMGFYVYTKALVKLDYIKLPTKKDTVGHSWNIDLVKVCNLQKILLHIGKVETFLITVETRKDWSDNWVVCTDILTPNEISPHIVTCQRPTVARFVKMYLSSPVKMKKPNIDILGFHVYLNEIKNLALNMPATQSTTDGNRVAKNANDGNKTTASVTKDDDNAYWYVDLVKTAYIQGVEIIRGNDVHKKNPELKVFSRSFPTDEWILCKDLHEQTEMIINTACDYYTNARYVKIEAQKKNNLNLEEVKVMGYYVKEAPQSDWQK